MEGLMKGPSGGKVALALSVTISTLASAAGPHSLYYELWVSCGSQIRGAGSFLEGLSGGCPELHDHGRVDPSFLYRNGLSCYSPALPRLSTHLPTVSPSCRLWA